MLHRNEAVSSGTMTKKDIVPLGSLIVIKFPDTGVDYECMLVRGSHENATVIHLKSGNIWNNADLYTLVRRTPDGRNTESAVMLEDLDEYIGAEWRLVTGVTITRNDPPELKVETENEEGNGC